MHSCSPHTMSGPHLQPGLDVGSLEDPRARTSALCPAAGIFRGVEAGPAQTGPTPGHALSRTASACQLGPSRQLF